MKQLENRKFLGAKSLELYYVKRFACAGIHRPPNAVVACGGVEVAKVNLPQHMHALRVKPA